MLERYKIHEVAKDFGVPSKTIIEMLKGMGGDRKYSTMTTIEGLELDLVYDKLTQNAQVESFDALLASAKPLKQKKSDDQPKVQVFVSEGVTENELEAQAQEAEKKPEAPKKAKTAKSGEKTKKEQPKAEEKVPEKDTQKPKAEKPHQKQQKRPETVTLKPKPQQPVQGAVIVQSAPQTSNQKTARVVDMRSGELNADKYNTRYDDLAHAKSGRSSEHTVGKQKLNQKSQQYRQKGKAGRQTKKETEAERMKRLALERKLKPITVTIPDEITVGELASRMKIQASEIIKKLMMLGVMAGINEVIDFDTAYLVATELHAKVEKEV
ncbi:MAG: translation initiation factor IF-2 N-terminal domain-containing protein, partial [Clostridia bacterium]|nr:translation initiation factor IF-2 N-terminal domain-containing protein [Clostridia bacterium]